MKKLTARQEEFLIFFAAYTSSENYVTEAAECFHVSKPTVSVLCSVLAKYHMLVKNETEGFSITPEGREYIHDKVIDSLFIAKFFCENFGMTPLTAEAEARKLVTNMNGLTVQKLIEDWKNLEA